MTEVVHNEDVIYYALALVWYMQERMMTSLLFHCNNNDVIMHSCICYAICEYTEEWVTTTNT